MNRMYTRGDLYYATLQPGLGSEQKGLRPVVIIQNNTGNRHSPTVIVAAISSKESEKTRLPTHYQINAMDGLKKPSIILLEQIHTIDKHRLARYIGHLSEEHIAGMDRALAVSVDLLGKMTNAHALPLCNLCPYFNRMEYRHEAAQENAGRS